eukprot:752169-Hanusia_phi.AAC.1
MIEARRGGRNEEVGKRGKGNMVAREEGRDTTGEGRGRSDLTSSRSSGRYTRCLASSISAGWFKRISHVSSCEQE